MEIILSAIAVFALYKAFKFLSRRRKANEIGRDLTKTWVQTAKGILEAEEARTSDNDILAANAVMARLVGFVGAIRDVYGITYKTGSFAEKYAQELTANNYGYVWDAQEYIAKQIAKEISVDNFGTVLMGFLDNPPPKFERRRIKSFSVLCLMFLLCSCANEVSDDAYMYEPAAPIETALDETSTEKAARQVKYKELARLSTREWIKCGFKNIKSIDDKVSDAMTVARVLVNFCKNELDESIKNQIRSEDRKPKEPVMVPLGISNRYPELALPLVLKSRAMK